MSELATADTPRPAGVEARIEAFEAAVAAGGSIDLARFLPPTGDPEYLAVLCELVRVDLEFGWRDGRPTPLAGYRARFPELFARPDLASAVVFEERRLREQFATAPGMAETPPPIPLSFSTPPDSSGALSGLSGLPGRARPSLPGVGDEFLGFQLVEELGAGSFGRVFLARQQALSDRPVALKVTARTSREAQHLARFQHTNIVPVLSVHHAGAVQAVCMPYYGRTTLRNVLGSLRRHDSMPASGEGLVSTLRAGAAGTRPARSAPAAPGAPVPAPDAPPVVAVASAPTRDMLARLGYTDAVAWLGARLAEGLAHAHDRGVLHRDVKPENVLLADDGQPMLLDFNLADDAPPGAAGGCGGTLLYMAPEHLAAFAGDRTRPVDARSDLYALGLVLYELLTGRHPSLLPDVGDRVAALRAVRGRRPDPVRRWNPAVSPAVGAVVAKLLDPDPGGRYQTARQLQEDLDRHLAHLPLRYGREPSVRERARKWARRNPRAVALLALTAAVALAGGLGAAVVDRNRARVRAEVAAAESARAEAETRAAIEARVRWAEFRDDLQTARVLLAASAADSAAQAAGVARARAALDRYGALEKPDWHSAPAVDRLSESDRAELRADAGEALLLLARAADRKGDSAAARDFTRRAEAHLPASGAAPARDAYLDGIGKAVAGRWAEAVGPLEQACALDPRDLSATFALGYCLDALGRDAEALECYRACTALKPEFPWPYLNRGGVYLRRGDSARARADFGAAVRLAPDWADARFARGTLFQKQADDHRATPDERAAALRAALADFDRAAALNSPRARLYFLRAQVKARLGDADGAAADRAAGFAAAPSDEYDHLARGVAYLPREPEKAVAAFDQALALNPRSLAALQNRAHVLAEYLKRPTDAVAALDRLVEQYPQSVPARGGRAVLQARLGKRAEAHRDATECLRRDTAPGTLYQLAGVYALTSTVSADDAREALRLLGRRSPPGSATSPPSTATRTWTRFAPARSLLPC